MHSENCWKQRKNYFLLFCILLTLSLFAGSCSLFVRPTAVLWTSVPEFASYIEVYNSQQDIFKIELVFKPNPVSAFLKAQEPPDLIIAPRLTSSEIINQFASLEKMYKDEELNSTVFYPQLLEQGIFEEEQVVLPVCFKIPMILFRSDLEIPEDDNLVLSYQDLRLIGEQYEVDGEELPEVMCFVTYWEPEFLYYTSYLEDAAYRESLNSEMMWNTQNVNRTILALQRWSTEINGSIELEKKFTERYMYNPGYKMLNTGRIILYYTTIAQFFNIPAEKRATLDFRWYGREKEIPLADDILFLGMYKKAKNKRAAKNFIQWFFKTKSQQELLESSQRKRIGSFGIAQGFSSMIQVNEHDIRRYFPEFTGRIPPKEYISPPPPLPPLWDTMKPEMLVPWFREQVELYSDEPLEKKLQTWYLQLPAR